MNKGDDTKETKNKWTWRSGENQEGVRRVLRHRQEVSNGFKYVKTVLKVERDKG